MAAKANVLHTHAAADIATGILPVARGGTGTATLTSGYFLKGNGTGAIAAQSQADALTALGIITGTWTPTVNYASSYHTRVGCYLKVGNMVTITFAVRVTVTDTSASGQQINISGVPYTPVYTAAGGGAMTIPGSIGCFANGYYIEAGSTSFGPRAMTASGGISAGNFSAGYTHYLYGSITYYTE